MILCCGEALIDMIPRPVETGESGFVPYSGGAIFNTAIALGRLGIPTGFISGLSTDLFGQQLVEDLAKSNVDASHAVRSDLPTTLAFVRLEDGHATYTFYDENTAGRSLTPETLPQIPNETRALYFGGISLISEPCADFYAALAKREAADRTIMLDPNIRPGFIRDEARYRARLDQMMAVTDILKVSDEDLAWIAGNNLGYEEQAKAMLSSGVSVVIVTRGSEGAVAFCANGTVAQARAPKVEVVDTVGAGDTFNAGVLASLSEANLLDKSAIVSMSQDALEAALSMGASVAAVTVSRAGANPPWRDELNAERHP